MLKVPLGAYNVDIQGAPFQWENIQMLREGEIHCHKPIYCGIISVCLSVIFNLNSPDNFIYIQKPNHFSSKQDNTKISIS